MTLFDCNRGCQAVTDFSKNGACAWVGPLWRPAPVPPARTGNVAAKGPEWIGSVRCLLFRPKQGDNGYSPDVSTLALGVFGPLNGTFGAGHVSNCTGLVACRSAVDKLNRKQRLCCNYYQITFEKPMNSVRAGTIRAKGIWKQSILLADCGDLRQADCTSR